jgi:putative transposase
MSDTSQSLSHSRWHGKYHVVFVPKRRRKSLDGPIRKARGAIFHELARQKACRIIAGHVMPDHGQRCIESPPNYSVASGIGFLKGKSAIAMARQLSGRERHFTGEHFWARGYAVSTVGFALEHVRAYIRDQQSADEEGRFERKSQHPHVLAKTHVVRSTAFEAVLLIKPPALPGVSDSCLARFCLSDDLQSPTHHLFNHYNRHGLFMGWNSGSAGYEYGLTQEDFRQHIGVEGDHACDSASRRR